MRGLWMPVALAAAMVASGCSSIPAAEFSAYRDAFDRARVSGEVLLLDYGAARAEKARLEEKAKPPVTDPAASFALDVSRIADAADAQDPVAVRLRAWAVVASYNEGLTRLAEGKSTEEVAAALSGFVRDAQEFPIESVSKAVSASAGAALEALGPYAGLLKAAATAWWEERARKTFLETVERGAPLVQDLVSLLEADASDFYATRLGLHEGKRFERLVRTRGLLRELGALLAAHDYSGTDGIEDVLVELDEDLRTVAEYAAGGLSRPAPAAAASAAPAVAQARVRTLSREIRDSLEELRSTDRAILAYRETVVEYVRILRAMRADLLRLRLAAARGERTPPSPRDLANGVARFRAAWEAHKAGR